MDTITEDRMAISMALIGGLGIIHRYCSIEDQVSMVKKVKRHTNFFIDNPYQVYSDSSVNETMKIMLEKNVGCVLIKDSTEKLIGIVSRRDMVRITGPNYTKRGTQYYNKKGTQY